MIAKKVLAYMRKFEMLSERETCLIGLSGGMDSVCLLRVLVQIQRPLFCKYHAVHIHHNIRGEEADRDIEYCRQLCESLMIPFYEYYYDVPKMAKERGIGLEEMGRIVRREAYTDCMAKHGATKLALAHHQNDLAETMMFHLARGTSLGGMAAMRPVRGNVIRPLLCVTRKEIEAYVKERGLSYCEDRTNLEEQYTRNRIRHHVLPYLTDMINPKTIQHMAALSEDILDVQEYMDEQEKKVEKEYTLWSKNHRQVFFFNLFVKEVPELLQRMVILSCMEQISGTRKNITREHVESVKNLWKRQVGKQVSLPYDMVAIREYRGVSLMLGKDLQKEQEEQEVHLPEIPLKDHMDTHWGIYSIKTEVLPNNRNTYPQSMYTKWFDYDKIGQKAVFRTRQPGDYIVINNSGARKKLKDYFIDHKIPKERRDQLLLLAVDHEILWVVDYRRGESAKITQQTKQMVKIQIMEESTDE